MEGVMADIMALFKVLALILVLTLCADPFNSVAQAQARDPSLRPLLIEGQMFTVRVVPNEGMFRVYVVGNQVGTMQLTDVGVRAYVRVGEDMEPLAATHSNEFFVIPSTPPDASEMKLEVRYRGTSEQFSFKIE
jgi:hypothetical protein